MPKVLVLSDNAIFKNDLIGQIQYHAPEFTVIEANDNSFDVIVVDGNNKFLSSCSEIKAPVIYLGDNNDVAAKASQVISKPIVLEDFLDCLRAAMSFFENSDEGRLEFGDYILYPARREIVNIENEQVFKLTEKETAILKYLYKNADKYVSKQDLLTQVWEYAEDATTHTVETHIYRLRQKVEAGGGAELIETSEGGYKLR
mgnify:CR=1 FL=1